MTDEKELSQIALGKAAAEVQAFLGQFKALTVVAAALQEAGGIERRLVSLRQELAEFPAKRQEVEDGIVQAAEGRLSSLKGQIAGLTEELSSLRTKTAAAREELSRMNAELESKRNEKIKIDAHIADVKAKFA